MGWVIKFIRYVIEMVVMPVGVLFFILAYAIDKTWLTDYWWSVFIVVGLGVYLLGLWLYTWVDDRMFDRKLERVGFIPARGVSGGEAVRRRRRGSVLIKDKVVTSNERIK